MKVMQPKITTVREGRVRIQARVHWKSKKHTLWYEFDAAVAKHLQTSSMDAFAVGLVLEAMNSGENLELDGALSARLHRNLHYYMCAMSMFYPHLKPIEIRFDSYATCSAGRRSANSAMGFSCGIDSFCTLQDKYCTFRSKSERISMLTFINVGSHGCGPHGRRLFHSRLRHVSQAVQLFSLPLLVIDSNLSDLCQMPFEDSYTARSISSILHLQSLIGCYYVASHYPYSEFEPDGSTPLCDHLLSSDDLDVVHDGAQYTRVEKSRRISQWAITHSYLNVCTSYQPNARNCSRCDKCVRAMLTFDMLGCAENYAGVFDYSHFETSKQQFASRMYRIRGSAPNWKQITDYAESVKYSL